MKGQDAGRKRKKTTGEKGKRTSPFDIWNVDYNTLSIKSDHSISYAHEEKYLSMLLNQILPLFLVDYRKVSEKIQLNNAK